MRRASIPTFRHHIASWHYVHIKPNAWTNHLQEFVGYKHAFVICARVCMCTHVCTWEAPVSYELHMSCACVWWYVWHVYEWMRRLQAFVGYEYASCVIAHMASVRMDNVSASICMPWNTPSPLACVWCVYSETRPMRACRCCYASLECNMYLAQYILFLCILFPYSACFKVFSTLKFHKTSKFDMHLRPIRI
jgi:hypothetical protein